MSVNRMDAPNFRKDPCLIPLPVDAIPTALLDAMSGGKDKDSTFSGGVVRISIDVHLAGELGSSPETDEKNRAVIKALPDTERALYELCTDEGADALRESWYCDGDDAKKKKLCVDDDRVARRFPCPVKGVVVVDLWEWY